MTLKLLEVMDIQSFVLGKETTEVELAAQMEEFKPLLAAGKQVAFAVRKGALEFDGKVKYENRYSMLREEIIRHIAKAAGEDLIVSTTGKASRELFEIREDNGQAHGTDFLTVGSMGHSSSIALGIALQRSEKRVWVIDGDGAVLMHMGSLAVLGEAKPKNLVHVVINNEAHETVGGQPTAARSADLTAIARACGYPKAVCVNNLEELDAELEEARGAGELRFIEAKCAIGARSDLGRPTTAARENKENFMAYLTR